MLPSFQGYCFESQAFLLPSRPRPPLCFRLLTSAPILRVLHDPIPLLLHCLWTVRNICAKCKHSHPPLDRTLCRGWLAPLGAFTANFYVFCSYRLIRKPTNTTASSACQRKPTRILSDTIARHSTLALRGHASQKAWASLSIASSTSPRPPSLSLPLPPSPSPLPAASLDAFLSPASPLNRTSSFRSRTNAPQSHRAIGSLQPSEPLFIRYMRYIGPSPPGKQVTPADDSNTGEKEH